ncbi:MAG: stress-induced protein [Nitrososphaera sp.]
MANNNTTEKGDKRGLASADEQTRERVARAGGEARAQDKEGLAQAGRKGGEAVVQKYGPEHMAEIGRKGGEASYGGGNSNSSNSKGD